MRDRSLFRRLKPEATLLVPALLFLSAVSGYAGPVTGRVVDPAGEPVPGARLLVIAERSLLRTATTDADGRFAVETPDSGRLELRVALDGFRAESLGMEAAAEARDVGTLRLQISAVSESIVVSAAQVEIPLSQASASVTVIDASEIQQRQIHTVADALRSVPGLAVASTGGYGSVTGVFPRGGESDYTLVFIDGVQANGFGGEFDFAHLSTASVERIEIVRGPQSALFGSNAIGAVVRVITRRGGPPSGTASIEAGSFGTSRWTAAASGSAAGWEWGGSAERLDSDGANGRTTAAGETVENDDYRRHALAASAGWRGREGATLRSDVRYARDTRGFPGPFGSNPVGGYSGIDRVSRGDYDRWTAAVTGGVPLGERLRVHGQVALNRVDGDFLSPFGDSESRSRRIGGRVQADVAAGRGLDFSAGIESFGERAGSTYITGEFFQPVPVTRHVTGYFAEARWSARQRLFVTGGLRVDDIRRHALEANPDTFSPRPELPAESIVSANPKLAVAWFIRPEAGSHTKVRASAGTGIRPPDGFEIAFSDNPSLQPERSVSAEAGIEQAFAGGRVLIEATAFANEYDDLIIAVGSFTESSRYRTDNISNARARGVELAGTGRTRIERGRAVDLEARVAYTFLDTEILAVDGSGTAPPPFRVGDALLRRPRHQVSIDLTLRSGPLGAYVHGGGRGPTLDVEPSLGTFAGRLFEATGYAVWHAGASWRLPRGVEIFGRVENLFDREYEEAFGYPAPGRGGFVGLRVAAGR